ncbi:MAG: hypothetical protein IT167_08805 [Bryobacterales bacterium]|nr:hypothetical protein [Bryobacterales bacterium]
MKGFTVLVMVFGPVSMGMARPVPRAALTVLIGDTMGIDASSLHSAAALAWRIVDKAGVHTEWTACPASGPERASQPRCLSRVPRPDLLLWILPSVVTGHPAPRVAMGMALPGNPGELGKHAYIYYDRVRSAAQFCGCDEVRTLGHAIAHEIGHLLGNTHSTSGIMRADWNRGDLVAMSRGHVLFSPEEARRIRANVAQRLGTPLANTHRQRKPERKAGLMP